MGYQNKNFLKGLITAIEKKSIPLGSASKVKNWIFKGDQIEVATGRYLIGSDIAGSGSVKALHTGLKANGEEVLFTCRRGYLEYYDTTTKDFIRVKTEAGEDIILTDVDGTFSNYFNIVGAFTYLNNPSDGMYKIITANPQNAISLYDASKNHKGYISIKNNTCFLWGKPEDKTGQYRSYVDARKSTTATAEAFGTGDGSAKTFNHTLSHGQAFALTFATGGETFKDNYDGTLTGSAGGYGTINYMTGVCSITFAVAPALSQAITITYQYEDPKNNGLADFTFSATRLAGQGNFLRQDGGGDPIMRVCTYNEYEYSFKKKEIYKTQYSDDDTTATNRIFREGIGIPNHKALVEQADGVYFINTAGEVPIFMRLGISNYSSEVIPIDMSSSVLDLSTYDFSDGACGYYENYVFFAGKSENSTYNDVVFVYDKNLKCYTILEWSVSCFALYNNILVVGDSVSNNIYELFSGYDDCDYDYITEIELRQDDMGTSKLKKSKVINFDGYIGIDQEIEIYGGSDDNGYTLIDIISGRGGYVDMAKSKTIGSETIGRSTIGGSGMSAIAYHYFKTIKIRTPKFLTYQLKFMTRKAGYASISMYDFQKLYTFIEKAPRKYQV